MPADFLPDDPRALWQAQPTEGFRMAEPQLRAGIARQRRELLLLTLAMYGGGVLGLIGFTYFAVRATEPLTRAGALLLAPNFALGLYLTHRARPRGASLAAPSLAYHRDDLARHRDLVSGWRLWYRFATGVPAVALVFVGFARAAPGLAPVFYVQLAAAVLALGTTLVSSRRRARRFQAQIDALDAMARQP